jgi:HlyD family secretion protein
MKRPSVPLKQKKMKLMKTGWLSLLLILLLWSCETVVEKADAYGNFEADELIVSAEGNGRILQLDVEEGQRLKAGTLVGLIDTVALQLKKQQLLASIQAIGGKTQDATPQIEVLKDQKANLLREEKRVKALLEDKAATPKQLDDIQGQIEVIEEQMAATKAQIATLNRGILGEIDPVKAQIKVIEDQIKRCYITNPVDGTVLSKLTEAHEFTAMGKPLYKIANLDDLILRAYVSGDQLPYLNIGQEVDVFIDADETTNQQLSGTVTWIANQAEFTPKIVQTKQERVNLVYAVKIKVANDGRLKIGMPAEILFMPNVEE